MFSLPCSEASVMQKTNHIYSRLFLKIKGGNLVVLGEHVGSE